MNEIYNENDKQQSKTEFSKKPSLTLDVVTITSVNKLQPKKKEQNYRKINIEKKKKITI